MAKFLRILSLSMYTKLLTISFTLLFATVAYGQEVGNPQDKNPFEQGQQINKIDIYPNPAVEYLIVQVSNSRMQKVEFEMHSIIGNLMTVQVQDMGDGRYRIPVESLATGYYFLIVKDEASRFKKAFKFLKD